MLKDYSSRSTRTNERMKGRKERKTLEFPNFPTASPRPYFRWKRLPRLTRSCDLLVMFSRFLVAASRPEPVLALWCCRGVVTFIIEGARARPPPPAGVELMSFIVRRPATMMKLLFSSSCGKFYDHGTCATSFDGPYWCNVPQDAPLYHYIVTSDIYLFIQWNKLVTSPNSFTHS